MELTREDLLETYRQMVLTRVFDTKTQAWHRKGLTRETIHASTGQEAICTGSCYGLRETDMVMPSLRSRGAFFARGVDPRSILLAQTGKRGSPSDGHEASHHTAFPELGILAGTGIVGSSISIGVGAALASQIRGRDDVVLIFFGDGATNRGDFHEAANMAAVWKLPCVFIIENNQVAMSTMPGQFVACKRLSDRAVGYGMPGYTIDGNDVLEVHRFASEAISRARNGEGPTLLDCVTFRIAAHADIFPDLRPRELIEEWEKRCPIRRLENHLVDNNLATPSELEQVRAQVDEEVERAFASIADVPSLAPDDMLTNVYGRGVLHE